MIQFLLHNGIGQNVSAGILMGIPTFLWAHRHIKKFHSRIDTIELLHKRKVP